MIAWLEFEPSSFEVAVLYFSRNTTITPHPKALVTRLDYLAQWFINSWWLLNAKLYISLRKTKTCHIRIMNLFPSCYGYWYESIIPKNNRTSSDLMDKIIQNRPIRSEEVLLFLVLLIHINTHNRMEINS